MRSKRRSSKGVYVVKSEAERLKKLEPKKQMETRGVYVLRESEEVVNKFSDIIFEYAENKGLFVLVGSDKIFYQTLRRSLVFELGLDTDFIQQVHEPKMAVKKMRRLVNEGFSLFVFLEHATNGENNMGILAEIKKEYPKVPVIITTREVDKEHLLQYYEEGANHILNKSASVNEVIRKIVHIFKPQTEIDELAIAGTKLNSDRRYEEAIRVANTMSSKRSKSARAHIIMGDALRGLAKRKAALEEYMKAEENSKMFIEPLKRIFFMYAEDNDKGGMLDYLIKLDNMSPLNFSRKVKIGDLNYDLGKVDSAEKYYDRAIELASTEAKSIVGEMSLDIAEKLSVAKPELAAKYYQKSLDLVKESNDFGSMTTFNRLGISLRKAGMWREAVEAYTVAEKLSPGDENIQYNLGLAHFDGKEYDVAAKHMFLALKMNPKLYKNNVEVAYNIGVVFKRSGDLPQAKKLIQHVLDIAPNHEGARALGIV